MPKPSIEKRIREIILDQLDVSPDQVQLESKFADDLDADSVDAVELAMALEEEFNINVPDEDAERLQTVADVIRYVEDRAGHPRR